MYINLLSKTSVITKPVALSGPKLVTLIEYKTSMPFKTEPLTLELLTMLRFTVGVTVRYSEEVLPNQSPVLFSLRENTSASLYISPVPFNITTISKVIVSPLAKVPIFHILIFGS
ncbi:hypothetical protein MBCUR_02720 [Methanobrevibacter curvatus]|uniref:Uncharacterized protein n=1 Tax=Methanobrevibacter curvatus TaxID=49547 RepID=A0A166D8M7_9EURY|nr:hypothetical protein MBCUR_02720 [Methanobrevibacter curvatus]